jgi:trehalose/maltose transport system permease protein
MKTSEITRLLPRPLLIAVNAILLVVVAVPLLYMLFASVNSDVDVAGGAFFPTSFHPDNYLKVWSTVDLAGGLINSVLVCGLVAVVSAFLAVATAYVLVRYAFAGRIAILRGLLALQSIPGTVMLLPVFVLFSTIAAITGVQIVGTRWGLFITYLTFALPFATWVMVTYIRGLPKELEEAARIDGASSWRILTRVILPLSWPGIVVAAIFSFLLGWNDVLFATIITGPDARTAAVVLQLFGSQIEGGALPTYGQLMAASLICAVPVVTLYLVFQRWLVCGLNTGSVK